jgi:hypothetical protein
MICPYCKEEVHVEGGVACAVCATPLHAECFELHGGRCVTLGCRSKTFGPPLPNARRRLDPAMPVTFLLRRGALAALSVALPPLEDAALAALAVAGVAAVAFFA